MPEVTIIGAGPAGSVAAILLARRGWGARIVEQQRFPREKVCGECLSALGAEVLTRLGLMPRLHAAGAVRLQRAMLHARNGAAAALPLPRPMWGISRRTLDALLLETARQSGAELLQPARCEQVITVAQVCGGTGPPWPGSSTATKRRPTGESISSSPPASVSEPGASAKGQSLPHGRGSESRVAALVLKMLESPVPRIRPRVSLRHLNDNTIRHIESDWVLLADGKAALLPHRPAASGSFGIQAHFQGVSGIADDTIELFAVAGHYGGVCRIEAGLWNVAFTIPRRRLRQARDLDHLFRIMLSENAALAERMGRARRVREWLATPLPRHGLRPAWPPGVIPVGNAAAAIEPIGGEGMGLAMRSAELAAECLAAGKPIAELQRQFRALWRTRSAACNTAPLVIDSAPALRLLQAAPPLQRLAWKLMGKG